MSSSSGSRRRPASTSGPIDNAEIAVAVLAELVARRAAGELSGRVVARGPETAVDPVCGMTVIVADAKYRHEHDGTLYFFCSSGCLESFRGATAGS